MRDIMSRHHVSGADVQSTSLETGERQLLRQQTRDVDYQYQLLRQYELRTPSTERQRTALRYTRQYKTLPNDNELRHAGN